MKERFVLAGAIAAVAGLVVAHEVRASAPPHVVGGPLRGFIVDPFAPEAPPSTARRQSPAAALLRGHLVDPFAGELRGEIVDPFAGELRGEIVDPFAGGRRLRRPSQTPALKLGFLVDPFRYDQDRPPARRDALVDPFSGERAAPDALIVDPFL